MVRRFLGKPLFTARSDDLVPFTLLWTFPTDYLKLGRGRHSDFIAIYINLVLITCYSVLVCFNG